MKIVHRAKMVNARGNVSPLCAKVPRSINLRKATWTNRDDAVTCPRCLAAIRARRSP